MSSHGVPTVPGDPAIRPDVGAGETYDGERRNGSTEGGGALAMNDEIELDLAQTFAEVARALLAERDLHATLTRIAALRWTPSTAATMPRCR